jgi:hypothetical protein
MSPSSTCKVEQSNTDSNTVLYKVPPNGNVKLRRAGSVAHGKKKISYACYK